jgi:Uma2 family endonuclease
MTTMNPIAAAPRRVYEPEDLLSIPDAVGYELVDGKLVERKMGSESSLIAARILILIGQFLRGKKICHVFGADASYQCFPDSPKKLRRADVSIVRYGRFPGEQVPKGHIPLPPDLIVEVVSPRDLAEEVEEKVAEYLSAGVRLVWIVYPATRRVRIRRPADAAAGSATELTDTDIISGEEAVPGFTSRVNDFFEEI